MSKNSAICAKRSKAPQSKGAGFKDPQGGYMSRDPGTPVIEVFGALGDESRAGLKMGARVSCPLSQA